MADYGPPLINFAGFDPFKSYQEGQQMARERTMQDAFKGGLPRGPDGTIDFAAAADIAAKFGDPAKAIALAQGAAQREMDTKRLGFEERRTAIAEKQAEEKPQYMKDENGNIVQIQPYGKGASVLTPGGAQAPTNPYAAPGKAPAEHEAKAALFADRIASSHKIISENENINKGFMANVSAAAANTLPEGVTTALTGAGAMGGAPRQNMMNAQRSFINALLRRESGAAINAGEFASYAKEYFPQPGDDVTTLAQKRERRQQVAEGLMREAGRTYTPPKGFVGSKTAPAGKPASGGDALAEARAAIQKGAPRDKVIERLQQSGIDPAGL